MPATALAWLGSLVHWSRKITTNSAVMAKSTPATLSAATLPSTPPSVQPTTQYSWLSRLTKNMNHPSSTPAGGRVE